MKKKLYEIGSEIVNVLCIYVVLMATVWAIGVARAIPELGIGVLVIATLLNFMGRVINHFGGADDGRENNEQS